MVKRNRNIFVVTINGLNSPEKDEDFRLEF